MRQVQTKQDILALISQYQNELKSLGVHRLGLFGSFVREEAHAHSDVDLIIEFVRGQKTFDNYMQVSLLLEETLQRPVELVTLESLSPYIAPGVLQEAEYVILSH
jgi:uncharacterized protein